MCWNGVRVLGSDPRAQALAASLGFCLAAADFAWAAAPAPSQLTPSSFAPKADLTKPAPRLPKAAPLAAPAGAQALKFRLRRIVVAEAFPELAAPGAALAHALEGHRITVAQLFALANALEKLYADNGYPLVRVTVPPQQLREGGDARLDVVDGYIEALSLSAVPERSRAAVSARVAALLNKRHLKYPELERAVLLAGDIAGVHLRSALARGQKPGGVLLALEADARLVSASLATDNNLPASLGTYEWNARLSLNNPLGFGEQAYLSLASGYAMGLNGFPMSPLRTLGAGFTAPLGADGLSVNPELTQSLTRPTPSAGTTLGEFDRLSLRFAYPWERTHDRNLSLTAAFEGINQELRQNGSEFNHDRYAAARLGLSFQGVAPWGAPLQASAQLSQGLGGRHPVGTVGLSRQGADPVFTKLSADAHLTQPLAGEFRLDLNGRGQWSFNKAQLASEQFSLDGPDALSAFTQGAFSADAGEAMRLEATRPFAVPFPFGASSLSPYAFAAQGFGAIYRPTAVEQSRLKAAAAGLGVRLAWDAPDGFTGGALGFELGHGVSNVNNSRSANRAAVNFSLRF